MKKSHFILGALSVVSLAMSACVSPAPVNSVIPKDAQFVSIDTVNANATSAKKDAKPIVYVVDLNKGVKNAKPGASVVINIAPPKDSFKTKASSNGKNSLAISSVRVNLCTNAAQPFASKITPNGFVIARTGVASGSQLTTIVLQNVPVGGPYNATFTADSSALNPTGYAMGEGFVMANNNGTAYSSPDAGARIAVSTNTVTVSPALALSFSSLSALDISANMEVTGAMVDTNVTTNDVGTPTFGAV